MTKVVSNVFLSETAALQTVLFRSYAYQHLKSGKWKVVIQGRRAYNIPTHLNLAKRLMLRGLLKRLENGNKVLLDPSFQSRVSGFLVSAETGHKVRLKINDESFAIQRRTRKGGMFGGRVTLPANFFDAFTRYGLKHVEGQPVVLKSDSPSQPAAARLFVAEKHGVSIISDIDDTIKQTDVTDRSRMLARTFIDPFQPITGMSDLYREWSERYQALFHYVSSSPWQLYSPLEAFLDEFHFPAGSIHLRWFTLREELLKKWRLTRKGRKKAGMIRTLIKRMPARRFVLVGDSGEHDLEIYASLAGKFAQSIAGVIIRNLPQCPLSELRVQEAKQALGKVPLKLFFEPQEIVDVLDEWSVHPTLRT